MGGFVLHTKMTPHQLRVVANKTQADLAKWFAANPKRRVCNAQLWYGRAYKIRKAHLAADIQAAYEDGLK